jgi:hypothetical protein
MIEDSIVLPPTTQAMKNRLAGIIHRMKRAGIVVFLNGESTVGINGSNVNKFKDHLIGTITGNDAPFIVVLNGITLNKKYINNANIRIGIDPNNIYDYGCYIRTTRGVRNFLSEIIGRVKRRPGINI